MQSKRWPSMDSGRHCIGESPKAQDEDARAGIILDPGAAVTPGEKNSHRLQGGIDKNVARNDVLDEHSVQQH